jgi:hypothetical protein
MSRLFQLLVLTALCLLVVPATAEARQYRYRVYYGPGSTYQPGRTIAPGVYSYPQIVTTPRYPVTPYSYGSVYPYGFYPYTPAWSAGYVYNPGSYYYWASPAGTRYYYTNPGFYYWYRIR